MKTANERIELTERLLYEQEQELKLLKMIRSTFPELSEELIKKLPPAYAGAIKTGRISVGKVDYRIIKNLNKIIREKRERLAKRIAENGKPTLKFDLSAYGVMVFDDADDDKIAIRFTTRRPMEDEMERLVHGGWHFSFKKWAWCRVRTDAARKSAEEVLGLKIW